MTKSAPASRFAVIALADGHPICRMFPTRDEAEAALLHWTELGMTAITQELPANAPDEYFDKFAPRFHAWLFSEVERLQTGKEVGSLPRLKARLKHYMSGAAEAAQP